MADYKVNPTTMNICSVSGLKISCPLTGKLKVSVILIILDDPKPMLQTENLSFPVSLFVECQPSPAPMNRMFDLNE